MQEYNSELALGGYGIDTSGIHCWGKNDESNHRNFCHLVNKLSFNASPFRTITFRASEDVYIGSDGLDLFCDVQFINTNKKKLKTIRRLHIDFLTPSDLVCDISDINEQCFFVIYAYTERRTTGGTFTIEKITFAT
ncbi:hypothetical protein AAAV70_28800 [Hungatella hathewayi]|uniref:hypothetical protein n=1 Tax=Hungatella hathewayi TaxID=154046 RepID=UPI0032C1C10D